MDLFQGQIANLKKDGTTRLTSNALHKSSLYLKLPLQCMKWAET